MKTSTDTPVADEVAREMGWVWVRPLGSVRAELMPLPPLVATEDQL